MDASGARVSRVVANLFESSICLRFYSALSLWRLLSKYLCFNHTKGSDSATCASGMFSPNQFMWCLNQSAGRGFPPGTKPLSETTVQMRRPHGPVPCHTIGATTFNFLCSHNAEETADHTARGKWPGGSSGTKKPPKAGSRISDHGICSPDCSPPSSASPTPSLASDQPSWGARPHASRCILTQDLLALTASIRSA